MPLSILKKRRTKLVSVKISTLDADMEFSVDQSAKLKTVFDLVCHTIGLRETWYFALAYEDANHKLCWLKLDKKIADQSIPRNSEGFVELRFAAKFYPEILEEELIQEITRHLFFLQFQEKILNEEIECQPEAAILLASYAVQAKYGDYDPDVHAPGFLNVQFFLPDFVVKSFHNVTDSMWEKQITDCYSKYHGLTREDSELEYLKIVQDFEMSGVNYFSIKDANGTEMWLGIDAKSVSLFPKSSKLQPIHCHQWSELADMSYSGNKFTIKQTSLNPGGTLGRRRLQIMSSTTNLNQVCEEISFFTDDPDTSKLILDLCKGNHNLFMQRRKVDSMEIQHMKDQAREEKARKQNERDRLKREQDLRIQIQHEKEDLEVKFKQLQDENMAIMDSLGKSEDANQMLSEKAKLAAEETMLLNHKIAKMDNDMQILKTDYKKTQDGNQQLKQTVHQFDQITKQLTENIRSHEMENDKLKEEIRNLKKALNDMNLKLWQQQTNMHHSSPNTSGNAPMNGYSMPIPQTVPPHTQVHPMHSHAQPTNPISTSGHQTMSYNVYSPGTSVSGLTDSGSLSNRNSTEFPNPSGVVDMQQLSQEIEKERAEYQLKTRNIEKQLQFLRSELQFLTFDDQHPINSNTSYDHFQPNVGILEVQTPHNELRPQYYEG